MDVECFLDVGFSLPQRLLDAVMQRPHLHDECAITAALCPPVGACGARWGSRRRLGAGRQFSSGRHPNHRRAEARTPDALKGVHVLVM
jgi:hypothetical protein